LRCVAIWFVCRRFPPHSDEIVVGVWVAFAPPPFELNFDGITFCRVALSLGASWELSIALSTEKQQHPPFRYRVGSLGSLCHDDCRVDSTGFVLGIYRPRFRVEYDIPGCSLCKEC